MAWRRSHYVTAGLVTAVLAGAVVRAIVAAQRPVVAPAIVVTSAYEEFTDSVRRRETLANVLARAGIVGKEYAALLAATRNLNARLLRPGQTFHFRRVRFQPVPDRVMVRVGPERRVWLERQGEASWSERAEAIPWTATRLRVSGVISSSLYEALDQAVPPDFLPAAQRLALAWAIADVYDWEVDFTHDIRPGDSFSVLIERLESPEGERRVGRILAGRVEAAGHPYYAFAFEADVRGGRAFYDERGRSLRRAFLKTPVAFRRISSRFGGRYHPILGRWRSHQGVDYSAAPGTPVRATSDGLVTKAGRDGGYGNLVELRHVNGIRTRYGHLSGFAAGVRVGERVRQGATIGYVGSTGLSTGPHLHYEFLVNGRATNPQRRDAGAGAPIARAHRDRFDAARAELQALLAPPAMLAPQTPPTAAPPGTTPARVD
jgi:murein DD-endopeptidase MepM/ murein hydrolase activator NlpD